MASLFDSGALARLRREEKAAFDEANDFNPPIICLHVVAEMIYGTVWANAGPNALAETLVFLQGFITLQPTIETAAIYARLRSDARRAGRQVPDPDFWIAAHAIEERLPLVTLDRHFTFFDEWNVHLLA